jgi:hypothetical protein
MQEGEIDDAWMNKNEEEKKEYIIITSEAAFIVY